MFLGPTGAGKTLLADSQPVPLCLMGTLDTQDIMLDQVSRTLHREVYGCR